MFIKSSVSPRIMHFLASSASCLELVWINVCIDAVCTSKVISDSLLPGACLFVGWIMCWKHVSFTGSFLLKSFAFWVNIEQICSLFHFRDCLSQELWSRKKQKLTHTSQGRVGLPYARKSERYRATEVATIVALGSLETGISRLSLYCTSVAWRHEYLCSFLLIYIRSFRLD